MPRKKKSSFRGKTKANAEEQKRSGAQYGYLNLSGGIQMYKETPDERSALDIIPYPVTDKHHPDRNDEREIAIPGSLWYRRPFKMHRNVGAANDVVVCPTTFRKKCPICEYRNQQAQAGADRNELSELGAKDRVLYLVIPKGESKYEDDKVHLWDISKHNFQVLLNQELMEKDDYEVFPDLEEGLTVEIRWESKTIGKGKPFAQASRIDFVERKEGYDENILEDLPDMDDGVLTVLTYDELHNLFHEIDEDEDEEGEQALEKDSAYQNVNDKNEDNEPDSDKDEEVNEDACIACKGTGEASDGETCSPCKGTGEKKKKPTKKEKEQAKRKEREKKSTKKDKDERCPHNRKFGGYKGEEDVCSGCEIWEECFDAAEED